MTGRAGGSGFVVTLATKQDRGRIRLFESHLGVGKSGRGEGLACARVHKCINVGLKKLNGSIAILSLLRCQHMEAKMCANSKSLLA